MKMTRCLECGVDFSNVSNLRRHVRALHPNRTNELAPMCYKESSNFNCNECGKNFNRKSSVRAHLKSHFGSQTLDNQHPTVVSEMKCPLCDYRRSNKNEMVNHFKERHDISILTENLHFPSVFDFREWKTQVENETASMFVKKKSKLSERYESALFGCNRSGNFKSQGRGRRNLKTRGSRKMNAYCPASITLVKYKEENACRVKYVSTHVGHEQDLGHLQLQKEDRQLIAQKIADKIPFDEIIDEIRDSTTSSSMRRIHLVNKKDLHNIKSSIMVRDPNNLIRIESWVDDIKGDNCFVFYKRQGEVLQESLLNEEDFVLIILPHAQINLLKRSELDVVCLDGTWGLSGCRFDLITLFIVDELMDGLPCCFMISNRKDEMVLKLFLSFIESYAGVIKPKVLISDLEEFFYRTWTNVMGAPETRLFCTWHIMDSWKKNVSKVKKKEKQGVVLTHLRALLKTHEQTAFEKLLESFCNQNDPDITEFVDYFCENYLSSLKCWAGCYRTEFDTKISKNLGKIHNMLKLKGLDKALLSIIKFVEDSLLHTEIVRDEVVQKEEMDERIVNNVVFLQSTKDQCATLLNKKKEALKAYIAQYIDAISSLEELETAKGKLSHLLPASAILER